jgi:peptidoglycan hydrolase-like protein with peptidoglycan-binding domain
MATPAHMKASGGRNRRTVTIVAAISATAVLAVGGIAVAKLADHHSSPSAQTATVGEPETTATHSAQSATAVAKVTTSHKLGSRKNPKATRAAAAITPADVVVTAITPGSGAADVATNSPLTVNYSEPLSTTPPLPTLSPPVAGTWTASGAVLTFVPTGGWLPYATETVTVPPGASSMVDGIKAVSKATTTTTFTVADGSETRLEQMLSELGYMPFTFAPTTLPAGVTTALAAEPTQADAVSTNPLPGALNWSYPNVPASLSALWTPGQYNVIDKGAIMAFENAKGMTTDGIAGPKVWAALVTAIAAHQATTTPYSYLMASETLPETLQVWQGGNIVLTSAANTGAPGATTQTGTFPVFEHLLVTTMTGTDPDGTKYVDPGIMYVAYFNGGDAVHQYLRASYGWPQSNGCVELPTTTAQAAWNDDPIGTLVTVLPPS